MNLSPLELAVFLSLYAKSIADAICEPLRHKFPTVVGGGAKLIFKVFNR